MKRTSFLGVSSRRLELTELELTEPFSFSFFSITGQGIGLDYCDIEWFALEANGDHSVVFEIASKYCISHSFVDHYIYYCRQESLRKNGVAIMVNKRV